MFTLMVPANFRGSQVTMPMIIIGLKPCMCPIFKNSGLPKRYLIVCKLHPFLNLSFLRCCLTLLHFYFVLLVMFYWDFYDFKIKIIRVYLYMCEKDFYIIYGYNH